MVALWMVIVAVIAQVHSQPKYNLHDEDYANADEDTSDPLVRSLYGTTNFNIDAVHNFIRYPKHYSLLKNRENVKDEDITGSLEIPVRGPEKPVALVVFEKIIGVKPENKPECYVGKSESITGSAKIECDGLSSNTVGKLIKYLFQNKHRKYQRSGDESKSESKLEDLLKNVMNIGSGVTKGQVPDSAKGSNVNAQGEIHTSSSSRGNTSIGVGDLQANAGFENNHQSHASGVTQNGSYRGTSSLNGNSNYYANMNVGNTPNNDRLNPGQNPGPYQGIGNNYDTDFNNRNPFNNLLPSNNGANYNNFGYPVDGESYKNLGPSQKEGPFNNIGSFNNGGSFDNLNSPNNAGTLNNRNPYDNPLINLNKNNLKPSDKLYAPNNLNPTNNYYPANNLYPPSNYYPSSNFYSSNNLHPANNLYPASNLYPANHFNHLNNGNPLNNANPYGNPYNNFGPYNQYGSLNNGKAFLPNNVLNVLPFNYKDVGLQVEGHQNYVDPKSFVNSNVQVGVHSHAEQIAGHPYTQANANSNAAVFTNPGTNSVVTVIPHRRRLNYEERSIDSDSEFHTQRGSYEINQHSHEPSYGLS